jgi:hypothetical protein
MTWEQPGGTSKARQGFEYADMCMKASSVEDVG